MIETITPAGCGSRRRYRVALAVFGFAAVLASVLLGALLGLAGGVVGVEKAALAAAALAALAAAREAGVLRIPLPQVRRQVPEWWRSRLPLPLWAAGYGAGLGVGLLTYQPVATFWVACAAALALADPLAAALSFAFYGLARTAMVAWPTRRGADAAAAAHRLVARRPVVVRLNVVALVVCAGLLAAAPAAGAAVLDLGPGSQLDPSVWGRTLAYTQRDGPATRVVVRTADGARFLFDGGSSASLDDEAVAYVDAGGIRLVRWQTGEEFWRVPGTVDNPALDWPHLVYRVMLPDGRTRLVLANLETAEAREIAFAGADTELGRPSLRAGLVAWHVGTRRGSRIVVYSLASGARFAASSSKIDHLVNPSVSARRIVWVRQRSGRSSVELARLEGGGEIRVLADIRSRHVVFWTTALAGRAAYVTRWSARTGRARLVELPL